MMSATDRHELDLEAAHRLERRALRLRAAIPTGGLAIACRSTFRLPRWGFVQPRHGCHSHGIVDLKDEVLEATQIHVFNPRRPSNDRALRPGSTVNRPSGSARFA